MLYPQQWINLNHITVSGKIRLKNATFCMITLKRPSPKGKIVGTENRATVAWMEVLGELEVFYNLIVGYKAKFIHQKS